jgi:hypothetical protein
MPVPLMPPPTTARSKMSRSFVIRRPVPEKGMRVRVAAAFPRRASMWRATP